MSYWVARDHLSIDFMSGPGNPKYSPVSFIGTQRETVFTTSIWRLSSCGATASSVRRAIMPLTRGRSSR
jgi:hypothetical protein